METETTISQYPDINVAPRWLKIWSAPRAVIRNIIDKNNDPYDNERYEHVGVLAYLTLGLFYGMRLGPLFLLAPFIAIGSLYLQAGVMRWVGSWFGGQATVKEVRIALGWSAVAFLHILLISALIVLMGNLTKSALILRLASMIVPTLTIIGLILQSRCIGEAHQFNGFKGFLTWLIGTLILVLPVYVLIYVLLPR